MTRFQPTREQEAEALVNSALEVATTVWDGLVESLRNAYESQQYQRLREETQAMWRDAIGDGIINGFMDLDPGLRATLSGFFSGVALALTDLSDTIHPDITE